METYTDSQKRRAALLHISCALELVSPNELIELVANTFAHEAQKHPEAHPLYKANFSTFEKLWDIANPKL